MKIILLALIGFICFSESYAQELKNTVWIEVKAERKDGSRIVDYQNTANRVTVYDFREKEAMISDNGMYMGAMPYATHDSILEIGKFVKFTIDTLNTERLILTQIREEGIADDKISRLTFISRNYIFNYLKENNLLSVNKDSAINYNLRIAPIYYGNFYQLFTDKFGIKVNDRRLTGVFKISGGGKIEDVIIENEKGFSKKDTADISDLIRSTSGFWMVPYIPAQFQYKMNFLLKVTYDKPFTGIQFSFIKDSDTTGNTIKRPGIKKLVEAEKLYEESVDLAGKNQNEEAVIKLLKCLEIDPLNIDAYYNLAYCYSKMNQSEEMCRVLKKLKDLGQKTGSNLYDSTCK